MLYEVITAGNTGTSASVVVTVNNAVPVTLTQIQAVITSYSIHYTKLYDGAKTGPSNMPTVDIP